MLSESLKKKIKGLTINLDRTEPQPEVLIRIPNMNNDIDYTVEIVSKEFTSICPLNTNQPDYAVITITYKPFLLLVELKSLKLYLVSYRNAEVFHEDIPATIVKDLSKLLLPYWVNVKGIFTTRGGLETTVEASYCKGEDK